SCAPTPSLLSREQNCPSTETKEKILENPAPPCLVPSHARALRGWRCGHFVALEAKVHLGGDGSRRRIGGGGNQLCMTEIRHSNQSPRNSECRAARSLLHWPYAAFASEKPRFEFGDLGGHTLR